MNIGSRTYTRPLTAEHDEDAMPDAWRAWASVSRPTAWLDAWPTTHTHLMEVRTHACIAVIVSFIFCPLLDFNLKIKGDNLPDTPKRLS